MEENCRAKFSDNWQLYQPAIIAYSSAFKNKPAGLKDALRDVDSNAGIYIFLSIYLTAKLVILIVNHSVDVEPGQLKNLLLS